MLDERQAIASRAHARELWREAARLYARVAKSRFSTPHYPDDVWRSAESYFDGHDYHRALALAEYSLHDPYRRQALRC